MKKQWAARLLALLAITGALTMTVSLATEAGSDEDPLITLSYLNDTFLGDILQKVDQKIAVRNEQISQQTGGSSGSSANTAFSVVTLSSGQTLKGDVGCEVMLRVGTGVCVSPSSPGLIDETTGMALQSGSGLSQNHLYMMTIEGRGVKATSAVTKLLVRGSYTIG